MEFYICAIIKNEHRYLREWIEYHLNLGFTNIFLFEDYHSESHSGITCDYPQVYLNRCSDYIRKSAIDERGDKRQMRLYCKFSYDHLGDDAWCAFIDIDEYINLKNCTLNSICSKFSDTPGLILYWNTIGADGNILRPEGKIVDNYKKSTINASGLYWKSFVNLKNYKLFLDVHTSKGCIDTNYKESTCAHPNPAIYDSIWINHYFTKSYEDWQERFTVRGDLLPGNRHWEDFFVYNPELYIIQDNLRECKSREELITVINNTSTDSVDLNDFLKDRKVIITMTSWTKRIEYVPRVLDMLKAQTIQPDIVYLNLATEEFPTYNIPPEISTYDFVKINWVEKNTKTFKKTYPVLDLIDDDDLLIQIDDDIHFGEDMIESRIRDYVGLKCKYGITSANWVYWCGTFNFGPCTLITKKMLKGWDKFLNDKVIQTYEDDRMSTTILLLNGYKLRMGRKYHIPDIVDDFLKESSASGNGMYNVREAENVARERVIELTGISIDQFVENNFVIDWDNPKVDSYIFVNSKTFSDFPKVEFYPVKNNYWFANIPKCACTYMKELALKNLIGKEFGEKCHSMIKRYSRTIDKVPDNAIKVAIWRDPVQRVKSIWFQFVQKDHWDRYLISNPTVDRLLDCIENELNKNIIEGKYEEHFKRQSDYYSPDDIDIIVKIEDLQLFLTETGLLEEVLHTNSHTDLPGYKEWESTLSEDQINRIKRLYENDYKLLEGNVWKNVEAD